MLASVVANLLLVAALVVPPDARVIERKEYACEIEQVVYALPSDPTDPVFVTLGLKGEKPAAVAEYEPGVNGGYKRGELTLNGRVLELDEPWALMRLFPDPCEFAKVLKRKEV